MRKLIYKIPRFKGKQRLLMLLDKLFGAAKINASKGVTIEGYYSSMQDMAFVRESSENTVLESALNALPVGGVFLDIGANCGFYSAYAAKQLGPEGTIISVEPSLREYRRLIFCRNNNESPCKWMLFNFALGDMPALLSLSVDSSHTGVNHISTNIESGMQPCLALTMDVLANWVLPAAAMIDLVKIDVEGYECNVLKGMVGLLKSNRIRRLNIEITDKFLKRAGSSKQELFSFLEGLGYMATIKSDAWQYDELFINKNLP
jgi:FkbM family methyltransferase